MAALSKVQNFSGSATSYINFGALAGAFPSNVAHTWLVYFKEDTGGNTVLGYLASKCGTGGEGFRMLMAASAAGALRTGYQSSGSTLNPSKSNQSASTPVNQWHAAAIAYDGSGVATTDLILYTSVSGASFSALANDGTNTTAGSGTMSDDAADPFVIGNRATAYDRGFKGKIAYVARFNVALSLSEVQQAFDNGPLSLSSCEFLWANGTDLKGGKTPTATGAGVTDDAVNLPPNTQLGTGAVTAAGAPQQITVTSPTGSASAEGAPADATGSPPQVTITAPTGVASAGGATTVLDGDFAGSNADMTLSSVTDAGTSTPTVVVRNRTPEDAEWQQWLYKLTGVAGKTIPNQVLLADKEDADSYLGSWAGPWWATDPSAGPSGWTNVAWSQVVNDRVSFTISPGANDTIYVASLPPWVEPVVLAWVDELAAAHPTRVHDDLPSRTAWLAANPSEPLSYVINRTGTGTDENGRTTTSRPMIAFRIGDDTLGNPATKRWIEVSCGVHPGEWNGGLMLRGFVDELLTGADSTALLTEFNFAIRPLQSPKGSWLGFRRNDPEATAGINSNANREWADGDTTNSTVVKWQAALDTDHGVAHTRVKGYFDFHDGKSLDDPAFFFWFNGQDAGNLAADYAALVAAEDAAIGVQYNSLASGSSAQYWIGKGVLFAWTAEVADEKSSPTRMQEYGAAYARSIVSANAAGMLGTVPANASGAPPQITVSAPHGIADDGIAAIGGGATVASNVLSPIKPIVVELTNIRRG